MLLKEISFVIPVFNRPNEIDELLNSFCLQKRSKDFEIVIVEDGSSNKCDKIINNYRNLNISYYYKENSGPGDSRNFGMNKAKGNYFIILDSDIILPENYCTILIDNLSKNFSECFGGVDDSHSSFNNFQKAVSFSMTSLITTGHVRGGSRSKNFQPRSFNMGISKEVFLKSGGFGKIHPGEDPDLSIRLKKAGFRTVLYENLKVFHKRRVSIKSFFKQVYKFGVARSILNHKFPDTRKITYWFPAIFSFVFFISIILVLLKIESLIFTIYLFYFLVVFIQSSIKNNILVGFLSVITTLIQFFGYGYGFIRSLIMINIFPNKKIESIFPKMFFN
ncbi:MAG: glycosyl transferase family 2 [Flavobacteriaceae bacterium]|nr:glycosyl transferase family 2 [Flavobacteriaceae bacterium]|tara:strand:+ start:6107 stop:7108 length:1002 start_codon:yes stop_codon:yes gene_type:complete